MKSLFVKFIMLYLVFTRSSCVSGRLGTIDRYLPEFTDTDDQSYTTPLTELDEKTDEYIWDYHADDIIDAIPNDIPLKKLVAHIELLAGQDGTTKGQYVYTDKNMFYVSENYLSKSTLKTVSKMLNWKPFVVPTW